MNIAGKDTDTTHFPIPRILFVRVTEACNASCLMCGFAGKQVEHSFSVRGAKTLAEELAESSIRHVRLTGGEPLLLEDIGQIVATLKEADLRVSIITNGMLLGECWSDLAAAGLDQIVVSLDSPRPQVHDRLRRTQGLFQRAVAGIGRVQAETPSTRIRVNTVVSDQNLRSLPGMFILLRELGVEQWSLIPYKPMPKRFPEDLQDTWRSIRERLRDHMTESASPHLMGNSLNLFGRDSKAFRRLMERARPQTPQPQCQVVEWIRFLDARTQRVFPCNCIPHRGKGSEQFGEPWSRSSWDRQALESSRTWLKHHGPTRCTGCEPLNVALGEGRIDLNEDLFGF